ncbi:hypothetical protein PGT21_010797 [Puccinia graminis f. sp. tritici]|uniref:Uncharacterized protein n=1 Tax=Puccinia graminis f. sp. tritici TaxID=56615 RepID=A0A5B0P8J8_PUCGR|nr:hypothetical protein PGT21_010797 [Puccinia graminis f. sp. tritici]
MNHHHQHHGQLKLQEQLLLEQQHQQQYSTNTPISSSDDLDEDEEEDEEEEDEEDEDDFPSKFLQTTHRKPVNIYEADMDLSDQLRNHNQNQQNNLNTTTSNPLIGSTGSINNNHLPNPNYQLQPSSHHHQQPLEPNLSPIDHPAPPIGYNHSNLPSTTRPGTHSLTPPGTNTPQPDQPPIIPFQNTSTAHPQSSPTNLPQPTEVSKDFHRHLGPIPPSLLEPPHSNSNNNNNNNNINNNNNNNPKQYSSDHRPNSYQSSDHQAQQQQQQQQQHQQQQQQLQQHSAAGLSASGGEASWSNGHRPHSRASVNALARPNKSQQQIAAPTTNRSRMGPSEISTPTHHQSRPRRVSDGSINGGVRKDILLQRMAEALQSERAKAIVFQRELQNAEREIDELANTLDEQRREHHKTIVNLRKDIKLLKKERESLVEALEAAEGVEQEEAERYLALLDPAAQAVMAEEEEAEEPNGQGKPNRSRNQAPTPQPILDDYDLSNYKSTIRAQMQERSALRAQRINSELLKINPAAATEANKSDSEKGTPDVHSHIPASPATRHGRPRETPSRIRRKLSKSRPNSRDGTGGLFWRRSGSRTRETNDDKSSSAPGTVMHRHPNQAGNRKTSAGHTGATTEEEGYYDSGPLQRSNESFGGRSHPAGNGKIGKLFRKVFPTYKDDSHLDQTHPHQDDPAYHDLPSHAVHERRRVSTGVAAGAHRRRQSFLD